MGTDTNTEYSYRISVWDENADDIRSGAGRGGVPDIDKSYYISVRGKRPPDDELGNIIAFINDIRNADYNQIVEISEDGEECVVYDNA